MLATVHKDTDDLLLLSLYKVSVASLCGAGTAAAVFSTLESIEAVQWESWLHTDL